MKTDPFFCSKCGREITSKNNCIHVKKISNFEVIFLMIFLTNIPVLFYFFIYAFYETDLKEYPILWIGNLSLAIFLFLLILFNYILNKPYLAMFFNCHQRIDRSLNIKSIHWPLCYRCTGILLGVFLSLLINYFFDLNAWMILLAIPLLIDGLLQKYTKYQSNQFKRVITGILFSQAFIFIFSYAIYAYVFIIDWIGKLIT